MMLLTVRIDGRCVLGRYPVLFVSEKVVKSEDLDMTLKNPRVLWN